MKFYVKKAALSYGNSVRQQEYQIILELSGEIPVKLLCETMGIQRSSFYAWKKKLSNPSDRAKSLVSNVLLFQEYGYIFRLDQYQTKKGANK